MSFLQNWTEWLAKLLRSTLNCTSLHQDINFILSHKMLLFKLRSKVKKECIISSYLQITDTTRENKISQEIWQPPQVQRPELELSLLNQHSGLQGSSSRLLGLGSKGATERMSQHEHHLNFTKVWAHLYKLYSLLSSGSVHKLPEF